MRGKIILRAGYGLANQEAKVPFTADTTAQIGSLTKTLTALAVLQLVNQGKLDLAAPVSRYLPAAAQPAANATLLSRTTTSSHFTTAGVSFVL
jgi:CubicO group peptidase (beta-lactamase class C family)